MSNRITYNRAMRYHLMLLFILSVFYGLNCRICVAASSSINVYLKLKPDNNAARLIDQFNHTLEQNKLLSTYKIKPFLSDYPLHITLYLTSYDAPKIRRLIHLISKIATKEHEMPLITDRFNVSTNGYVMLSVKRTTNLQRLSDQIVHVLASLRDKKAPIPAWAATDQQRSQLVNQWGSPSVFHYFNPHLSIIDPQYLSPHSQRSLVKKLNQLVSQFSQTHESNLEIMATEIGVGIANSQGQIVKELIAFQLGQ